MSATSLVVNGTVNLLAPRQALADAGSYFNVTNPTPGTAIVWATLTAFSATANGLFLVQNKNALGGRSIVWDRMYLRQTATAPTGTLSLNFDVFNETGLVLGTGNVATRTPVNTLALGSAVTGALVQSFAAGAITIPAAVGTRTLVDIGSIATGVTVAHDAFIVEFGGSSPAGKVGLTAARATDPAVLVSVMAPVVVAPQTTSWINAWWPTQAVNIPSLEFGFSYFEL